MGLASANLLTLPVQKTSANKTLAAKLPVAPVRAGRSLLIENPGPLLGRGVLRFLAKLLLQAKDIAEHTDRLLIPFPL